MIPSRYGPYDVLPSEYPLFFEDASQFSKADLLLGVGTNFPDISTWSNFKAYKQIIQLEADTEMIGKVYPPDIGIVGNIKTSLDLLTKKGRGLITKDIREKIDNRYTKLLGNKKELDKEKWPEKEWDEIPIRPWRLIRDVREVFGKKTIFIHDSGSFSTAWMRRCMDFFEPKTCYCCLGGIMGFALPGALGIKLASPDKDVVVIVGDGSFMMVPSALITSIQYKIPITIIINNNSSYMQIKRRQKAPYVGSVLLNPDFNKLANSIGIKNKHIENPNELKKAFKWSINETRKGSTVLLDVVTPSDIRYANPETYFK